MKITKENYHSIEASREYMSVSKLKSYLPQYGGCEAKTVAIDNGEWEDEDKAVFILGGYLHSWNEGPEKYKDYAIDHPEMFTKKGTLRKSPNYAIVDDMINTLKNDEIAMKALEGQKELIITDELFGMPWKIMIDSYNPEIETFTDLKTCREINRTYYNEYTRERENFIIYYGYDIQMAVYAEIERSHRGGNNHYMPHILAVSKEDPPDKELIKLPREDIVPILDEIEVYIPRVYDVWKGKEKPRRCGRCSYCRATKELTEAVHYMEIGI